MSSAPVDQGTAPFASRRGPWWKHFLYGVTAIGTGMLLVRFGYAEEGIALVGAGVAFLGVGAGGGVP